MPKTIDFATRLSEIQGKQFLQAYQTLKGSGQITEVEGIKAEKAIARLQNRNLQPAEFDQAVSDFESAIKNGLERARNQAYQEPSQSEDDLVNKWLPK